MASKTEIRKLTTDSDLRDVLLEARDLGFNVERTQGGHIKMTHRILEKPLFTSSTPSDHRAVDNTRSQIVRALTVAAGQDEERADYAHRKMQDAAKPGTVVEYTCPACLGQTGKKRSWTHPVGLVKHMEKEHPVEIQDTEPEPVVEDRSSDTEQEKIDVPQKQLYDDRLAVADLAEFLTENYRNGETIRLEEIRTAFPDKDVLHAILGLKRRRERGRTYPQLEQHGSSHSKIYRVHLEAPKPGTDAPAEVAAAPETNGHQRLEGRLFEEIGRDLHDNPLVRDADGKLWTMELKPLV